MLNGCYIYVCMDVCVCAYIFREYFKFGLVLMLLLRLVVISNWRNTQVIFDLKNIVFLARCKKKMCHNSIQIPTGVKDWAERKWRMTFDQSKMYEKKNNINKRYGRKKNIIVKNLWCVHHTNASNQRWQLLPIVLIYSFFLSLFSSPTNHNVCVSLPRAISSHITHNFFLSLSRCVHFYLSHIRINHITSSATDWLFCFLIKFLFFD